jgi:hypothetical protein
MVQARHAISVLEDLNNRGEADAATLVWAYLGTGDNKKALDWLEKAYSQHSDTLTTLRVEPAFDPLRNDPRFQDLLRRVRLDQ